MSGEMVTAICAAIAGVCGLLPTVAGAIIFIINIIKNKDWDKVKEVADRVMKSVEDYARAHPGELSSEQKLDMALQSIENALTAEGIKFSAKMTKRTIAYIKDCVAWFNGMNGR